jgi:hypothetical protein
VALYAPEIIHHEQETVIHVPPALPAMDETPLPNMEVPVRAIQPDVKINMVTGAKAAIISGDKINIQIIATARMIDSMIAIVTAADKEINFNNADLMDASKVTMSIAIKTKEEEE